MHRPKHLAVSVQHRLVTDGQTHDALHRPQHLAVSVQHRLVTDGRTDTRRQQAKHCTNIPSRGYKFHQQSTIEQFIALKRPQTYFDCTENRYLLVKVSAILILQKYRRYSTAIASDDKINNPISCHMNVEYSCEIETFHLILLFLSANNLPLQTTNLQNCSLQSLALGFALTSQAGTAASQKQSLYTAARNWQE